MFSKGHESNVTKNLCPTRLDIFNKASTDIFRICFCGFSGSNFEATGSPCKKNGNQTTKPWKECQHVFFCWKLLGCQKKVSSLPFSQLNIRRRTSPKQWFRQQTFISMAKPIEEELYETINKKKYQSSRSSESNTRGTFRSKDKQEIFQRAQSTYRLKNSTS